MSDPREHVERDGEDTRTRQWRAAPTTFVAELEDPLFLNIRREARRD